MDESLFDLLGEHSRAVGFTCPDDTGVDVELFDRREEGVEEMLCIAFVFSAGTRDIADRPADILLIFVRKERVDFSERIEVVGNIDEFCLDSP